MISPNIENRSFFNERLTKHCGGDKAKAEIVDIHAFHRALVELESAEDAERFLGGHMHWLRGRRPQTMESAFVIAKANVHWCFEEPNFPKKKLKMWTSLLESAVFDNTINVSPEYAFKASQLIGEKIKAGKDPAALALLAKKALAKKGA